MAIAHLDTCHTPYKGGGGAHFITVITITQYGNSTFGYMPYSIQGGGGGGGGRGGGGGGVTFFYEKYNH